MCIASAFIAGCKKEDKCYTCTWLRTTGPPHNNWIFVRQDEVCDIDEVHAIDGTSKNVWSQDGKSRYYATCNCTQ